MSVRAASSLPSGTYGERKETWQLTSATPVTRETLASRREWLKPVRDGKPAPHALHLSPKPSTQF